MRDIVNEKLQFICLVQIQNKLLKCMRRIVKRMEINYLMNGDNFTYKLIKFINLSLKKDKALAVMIGFE